MHVYASTVFRLVALASLIFVAPGTPPALAAATSRLGTATFDARRSVVYLPYAGAAPKFTLFRLSPTHFYYELQPARLTSGNVQFQAIGGAIERFTLANRPAPDVVRLSFQLNRAAEPQLRVDVASHRLVVLPLGAEQAHPLATLGVPHGWSLPARTVTALGQPFIADAPRRLVLPFKGGTPQFVATTYQRNPRWIVMDVLGADPHFSGDHSGAFHDPLFEGWMLATRPEPHHTRLYLRLRRIVPVRASLGLDNQEIWMMAVPTPAAVPSPVAVPSPASVPPSVAPPTPAAVPSPVALPSPAAVPSPVALPSPAAVPSPVDPPRPKAVPTPVEPVIPSLVPHGRVLPTVAPAGRLEPTLDVPLRLPGPEVTPDTGAPSPSLVPRPN